MTKTASKQPNPCRQLGRVADRDWEFIKRAADKANKGFTQWALEILMREARNAGVKYPRKSA